MINTNNFLKCKRIIKKQITNDSMQDRTNFAKFIHDIEKWYKKRYSYDDGDEEDRKYIDKVINDQIEYANQLLSQGIAVDVIINNFEQLYQQEKIRQQEIQYEYDTVDRTGKSR